MYGNNREQIRRVFYQAWQKQQNGQQPEGVEALIVQVVQQHKEYQPLLADEQDGLDRDWTPEQGETNPFLHMGMHISIAEQLQVDQPAGIRGIYQTLVAKTGDAHAVEHQMMECLGKVLWQSQVNKQPPNEQDYLVCLRKLG